MEIPKIQKNTFHTVLKNLDLNEFPTLKYNDYLFALKKKLEAGHSLLVVEKLLGFAKFTAYLEECKKELNDHYVDSLDFTPFMIPGREPIEFQKEGTRWLMKADKGILADDQGLGKSIQVIMASLSLDERYKVLIVTKKTLKYNFEKEISFYTDSYKVIEKEWESGFKFTIVHYDSLVKFMPHILEERFEIVIADECHVLLNKKSKRSTLFNKILADKKQNIKKLWLLTGTPITNRPIDLFPLLKMIKHPISKNWMYYVERYCEGHKDYWGRWQVKGASNLKELFSKTTGSILRRLKKEHLTELPNKYRQPIFLNLFNRAGYTNAIKEYQTKKLEEHKEELSFLKNLFDTAEDVDVAEMTKLMIWRQWCAMEKIRDGSLFSLIKDEISEGNKVIVFTNFTKVVDAVYEHFTDGVCRYMDGRITDSKKRLAIIDEFNADDSLRLLVCNLMVGGTGLNIQSANSVIVNDMDWVPGNMLQAEDRAWRFGQIREVNAKYLVYKDTVEEVLYKVIDEKMQNITTAIEGKKQSYFNDDGVEVVEDEVSVRKRIMEEIFSKM